MRIITDSDIMHTIIIFAVITAAVIAIASGALLLGSGTTIEDEKLADINDTDNEHKDTQNIADARAGIIEITTRAQLAQLLAESSHSMNTYFDTSVHPDMVADSAMDFGDVIMESAPAPAPPLIQDSPRTTLQPDDSDYSTTNVQVAGVDEPDYIKNDGQYAYIAIDNTLIIADVWPASEMHIVTKVALDINPSHIENIFLNGNRLALLYSLQSDRTRIQEYDFTPQVIYKPTTHMAIIDITDRKSPLLLADYSIDGRFTDARMIKDHIYLITTDKIDYEYPEFPIIETPDQRFAPRALYFEGSEAHFTSFTTISSIDIIHNGKIESETFMMGDTSTHYMTTSNLYLTYIQDKPSEYDRAKLSQDRFFEVIVPLLQKEVQEKITAVRHDSMNSEDLKERWWMISDILQNYYNTLESDERERLLERIRQDLATYDRNFKNQQTITIIHKSSIEDGKITYKARGTVPGVLLNQFSLGEDATGSILRVATTAEYTTGYGGFERSNGVYTLDENLNEVGKLEGVAVSERIYSVRFMGDRMYMVTFKEIDPFFVIDISGNVPRILGELKIPGFSDYLHPYDDNHVIGIGRDTDFVNDRWTQELGVKIALFDVADVSNPKVADEIIIGDSGTHSDALADHKAFFFDPRQDIMSIPIEGGRDQLKGMIDQSARNDAVVISGGDGGHWSGFYIIDINAERKGDLEIRGTVSHSSVLYDLHGGVNSARTFYIEDVLYTVADAALVASDIDSLERLGFVKLVGTGQMMDYLE